MWATTTTTTTTTTQTNPSRSQYWSERINPLAGTITGLLLVEYIYFVLYTSCFISDVNVMPSGQLLTHCRTHLKVWISVVVIVQCLVLILYLIVVSEKGATQQTNFIDSHQTTQNTQGQDIKLSEQGFIAKKTQDNDNSLEYRIKHLTHPTARTQDHLNRDTDLKNANEILYRKIGTKRRNTKKVNRNEEILKKTLLHQARLAEKAERHRKQKLQGNKYRKSFEIHRFDFGQNLTKFERRTAASKTIGRDLKKVKYDGDAKLREKIVIKSEKAILGSSIVSLHGKIADQGGKVTIKEAKSEPIKHQYEKNFAFPEIHNSLSGRVRNFNTVSVSSNSTNIVNSSFFNDIVSAPQVFHLSGEIPTAEYFETRRTKYSTYLCYKPGTRLQIGSEDFLCSCEKGWHGKWCSFPDSLYFSAASQ